VSVDIVGEEEVQLPHRDIDVVGVHAEAGVEAVRGLFQPLTVRALQGDSLEQDHLHQVQPPHLEYRIIVRDRSLLSVLFGGQP